MQLAHQLLSSAIPMFANVVILFYVCQRFLAATRLRRKIMTEMREFTTIVRRARDNVQYIGEQVAKGMDEIKEDVGKELRVTDRLTTQSSKLAAVLQRFTALEENVIEMLRMERNRESVRIETPVDVREEIKRVLAMVEKKEKKEKGEWEKQEEKAEWSEESKLRNGGKAEADGRSSFPGRITQRNPLSKFSTCGPREIGTASRRTIDGRSRTSTMPEVRLLGEHAK
nr:uncharacterized protein LOC117602399 [Osmia lignaria]